MAEPECFSCLGKDEAEALRSYVERELHEFLSGICPSAPAKWPGHGLTRRMRRCSAAGTVPPEVIARVQARLLDDPFYMEEDDVDAVIAHYTESHGDGPLRQSYTVKL